MASIDKLINQNRKKEGAPSVTPADLGGGKFMPQSGKLIPTVRIRTSPYQPRLAMDPEELSLLAASISSSGLDTPVLVRPVLDGEDLFYELIDGHRRLAAVTSLRWEEIAANVREVTDAEAAVMALTATLVHSGYSPYETGKAMKRLLDLDFVPSKTALEKIVGIGRGDIYRFLSLASLPKNITAVLDANPSLIGGTSGEVLSKMVEEGDADLAHQAVLRVLDGEMKESHIEVWWRQAKAAAPSVRPIKSVAVRQDKHLYATMKPNKNGGFDIRVTPRGPISTEKLEAALAKALSDLEVVEE